MAEVCRQHGISTATCFQRKSKYAGMSAIELKRVEELEAENARPKRMYAEGAKENIAIKDVLSRRTVTPIARLAVVQVMVEDHHLSRVRAYQAVGLPQSVLHKPTTDQAAKDAPVINAINGVLEKRSRWGFWKCIDQLRRDGHGWNHEQAYRRTAPCGRISSARCGGACSGANVDRRCPARSSSESRPWTSCTTRSTTVLHSVRST